MHVRRFLAACLVFVLFAANACDEDAPPPPTGNPTGDQKTLSWEIHDSGVAVSLLGVSGNSDGSEVMGVGYAGWVFHYDGTSSPDSITSYYLQSVWFASSGKAFVPAAMTGSGKVFMYDGSTWTEIRDDISVQYNDVWGTSENNVYFAGTDGVYHYDGTSWDHPYADTKWSGDGIWVAPNGEVFCTALGDSILHFDGTSWEKEYCGVPWPQALWDLWGTAADDVIAVGEYGTIVHYNGSVWTPMNSGTNTFLLDVWGSATDNVYAVGEMGTILNYNGSGWNPITKFTTNSLNAVWGAGESDVYIVGDYGVFLHYGFH